MTLQVFGGDFWLGTPELAKERVAKRVSEGGHSIPVSTIERRFYSGLSNLKSFITVVDRWYIYNNESTPASPIARGGLELETEISNFEIWPTII